MASNVVQFPTVSAPSTTSSGGWFSKWLNFALPSLNLNSIGLNSQGKLVTTGPMTTGSSNLFLNGGAMVLGAALILIPLMATLKGERPIEIVKDKT